MNKGFPLAFRDEGRHRALSALEESQQVFRLLFNPRLMWLHDLETLQFIEVNDAAD